MSSRILIVEDEKNEREALARLLRMENYDIVCAGSSQEALQNLHDSIELVISDLRMEGSGGLDLLQKWKECKPATPFIMVTAYGDVDSGVEAMKSGAHDYVTKPVNPEELTLIVRKCLESARKDRTILELRSRLDKQLGFENIIGRSKEILELCENARRAALVDSTVLLTGESGTGKELVANAIHQNSPRKDKPFVTVNMAAVPEHLVESELFGHVKGAFTGATDARMGRFESANHGTLFIDEIGDFKLECQAKLLRVLENHTVTPIGSNEEREVNVRVVAATSRNLEHLVRDGQFRDDLYYRLNVVNLQIPPLRRRQEDIPLMVAHFLRELCRTSERPLLKVSPKLQEYLETYDWPGNVRQLRNCLESMVVLARGDELTLEDLPATLEVEHFTLDHVQIPLGTKLEDLEREAVEQALDQHDGNRTHAANALGISVRTLQRKLKAWNINENGRAKAH